MLTSAFGTLTFVRGVAALIGMIMIVMIMVMIMIMMIFDDRDDDLAHLRLWPPHICQGCLCSYWYHQHDHNDDHDHDMI